jgi:hypothetical protein
VAGHGGVRWARALTLASVMLSAGLSGHVAAGGVAPPTALVGPMLVILTLAVAPFLDAVPSTPTVVALVVGAQVALHVVLDLVGSTTVAAPGAGHPGMGHAMSEGLAGGAPGLMHTFGGAHLGMVAAHAGASLVVALWLAAGERAAWTLVDVGALVAVRAWHVVREARGTASVVLALTGRWSRAVWATRAPVLRSVWAGRGGLSRRGPPRPCAA